MKTLTGLLLFAFTVACGTQTSRFQEQNVQRVQKKDDLAEKIFAPLNYNGRIPQDSWGKDEAGNHILMNFITDLGEIVGGFAAWGLGEVFLGSGVATRPIIPEIPIGSPIMEGDVKLILDAFEKKGAVNRMSGILSANMGDSFTIVFDQTAADRVLILQNNALLDKTITSAGELQKKVANLEMAQLEIAQAKDVLIGKQGVKATVAHGGDAYKTVGTMIDRAKPTYNKMTFTTHNMTRQQLESKLAVWVENGVAIKGASRRIFGWRLAGLAGGTAVGVYITGDIVNDIRMGFEHDLHKYID